MAIIKFEKKKEMNILFGVILSNLSHELLKEIKKPSERKRIVKSVMNIHEKRLIRLETVMTNKGIETTLVVIFNGLVEQKYEKKYEIIINNFDSFKTIAYTDEIDVEKMIGEIEKKNK